MNKRLTAFAGVVLLLFWGSIFGAIQMLMFLPGTIQDVADASLVSNLSTLYLGIMPSAVAYYSWGKAISMAEQTSEATNYQFINPLLATIIGLIMLHEVPDAGTFIGGAIIIISVIVFSLKGENA